MTAKIRTAILSLATSFTIGSAAMADHREPQAPPIFDPASITFRANHPMHVFIDVDTRNERREAGLTAFEARALKHIRYGLPDYVQLVTERHHADLIVRAREQDYQFGFRVVDTDRKDKKYKKRNRHVGGRCGNFQKAYYTKVKEKGEAFASYGVKIVMRDFGYGRDTDYIQLRSAEDFSYGTDLLARTNCGIIQTRHMPSDGVAKLFARNTPEYRRHVAHEVREEAAADLGRALAQKIHYSADHYYTNLSTRLSQQWAKDRRYSGYGGDYGWSSEYSRHEPRSSDLHHQQRLELDDEDVGAAVLVATGLAILAATLDD